MPNPSIPLLDLALLQTLVAVNQSGTLAKAADRVGRTQSAVSLQMQRLEDCVGFPIFDRRGRILVLTPAGESLVGYARRMLELNREAIAAVRGHSVSGRASIGMSVDFEHTWLPRAMARFSESHPKISVELRVDRNTALQTAVGRGDIDIALVLGTPESAEGILAGLVPMAWIGAPEFQWQSGSSLPLLLLEQPCIFRAAATQALDAAGQPWHVAVTSPSLGGLWATALAGMGVTLRSAVALPPGLTDVGQRFRLPKLPMVGVRILEANGKPDAPRLTLRRLLHELAAEFVAASP
jgi:DNA-binding transcriptional LysR family regulator